MLMDTARRTLESRNAAANWSSVYVVLPEGAPLAWLKQIGCISGCTFSGSVTIVVDVAQGASI